VLSEDVYPAPAIISPEQMLSKRTQNCEGVNSFVPA
jgi:hypothetical protein